MIKEGYRNYDSPVAMPELGHPQKIGKFLNNINDIIEENTTEFTLEDYFAGLNKLYEDTGKTVKDQQVGGDHYQKAIQPWDIFLAWGLDPWAANVVKYILRFPHKNGKEDLEKAKHYVEYLLDNYDEVHNKYY